MKKVLYPPYFSKDITDLFDYDDGGESLQKMAKDKLKELLEEEKIYEFDAKLKEPVCYQVFNIVKEYSVLWFKASIYIYNLEQKREETKKWRIYWNKFLPKKKISSEYNEIDLDRLRNIPLQDLLTTECHLSAGRVTAPCPFHNPEGIKEKSHSFFIYPKDNSWHCFSCGSHGGNAINFVMERDHVDFKEAIKRL